MENSHHCSSQKLIVSLPIDKPLLQIVLYAIKHHQTSNSFLFYLITISFTLFTFLFVIIVNQREIQTNSSQQNFSQEIDVKKTHEKKDIRKTKNWKETCFVH